MNTESINKFMADEYVKWCDKAVSSRLYKPVDPEYIALSGAKADTFMGFFEGIIHRLALYEYIKNPPIQQFSSDDKLEDEEQLRKTADYIDLEPESPKIGVLNSFSKDDDKDGIMQESTSRNMKSSLKRNTKLKKMTEDVRYA